MSWAEGREGAGNIALHLPPGFIGIDVDDYDNKPGAQTLHEAETRWGPLPATWTSSARTGLSGIRYYRVPEGLAWPGQVGPGIETVHTAHRYAVVWPSIHPDTGGTYQWAGPDGQPSAPPDVDQLPELPAAWVQGLTEGREAAAPGARNHWDNHQIQQWLITRPRAFDQPCARMVAATHAARLALAAGAGAHDTTTSSVMRVVRLADDGHAGLIPTLGDLHQAFTATRAYRAGHTHDPRATESEWRRSLAGAVSKVSAASTGVDACDCDGRLTNTIVTAAGPPLPPTNPNPTGPEPQHDQTQPNPTPAPPPPDQNLNDPIVEDQIRLETLKIKIREEARRRVKREHTATQAPPRLTRLDHFLEVEDEPQQYRIEGLWPAGGRIVIAAQYKAGKTTTIGNLVRSLADGDPFLGRFLVHPPDGNIVLIDNELDDRMLRRWLRDQRIRNTTNVTVLPLRGQLSTFDILDRDTRAQWANELRTMNAKVAIVDCLAPILDSLGLSEDKEAGQFLIALDELAKEAGIEELVLVVHMGHNGERARGASRLRDWPDAEWRLVREKTEDDDPAARRYFSAYGRDVDVQESALDYHPDTRGLTLAGGSRAHSADQETRDAIVAYLRENPHSSGRQIELGAGQPLKKTRAALKALVDGRELNFIQQGRAVLYSVPILSITEPRLTSGNYAATHTPSITNPGPSQPPHAAPCGNDSAASKTQVNEGMRQHAAPMRQQGDEVCGKPPIKDGGGLLPHTSSAPGAQDQKNEIVIEDGQRINTRTGEDLGPAFNLSEAERNGPAWTAILAAVADRAWHPWAHTVTRALDGNDVQKKTVENLIYAGIKTGYLKRRGNYNRKTTIDTREIAMADAL